MAGTLTISTLSDGTNSTSSTNCIQGSAKAWVRYNGATSTLLGSYNVSSVTKVTTGQWYATMTNALADANYSAIGNVSNSYSSFGTSCATPSTASVVYFSCYDGGWRDYPYCSVAVFR